MGIEGRNETFYLTVSENQKPDAIVTGLNRHLPTGLMIKDCQPAPVRAERRKTKATRYRIRLKDGFFDRNAIECYAKSKTVMISRKSKTGKTRKFDLKQRIESLDLLARDTLMITLSADEGKTIRPQEVITKIFHLGETTVKQASIVKL